MAIYFRSYEDPYVLKNLPPLKYTIVIRPNSNSKTLLDWINLKVFLGSLNSLFILQLFHFINILFRQRPYSVNSEKVNILRVFSIPLILITSKESNTFDQITSKLHDCVSLYIIVYSSNFPPMVLGYLGTDGIFLKSLFSIYCCYKVEKIFKKIVWIQSHPLHLQ